MLIIRAYYFDQIQIKIYIDEEPRFSIGAKNWRDNFYVYDTLFRADDPNSALETRKQLIEILNTGGSL